MVPPGKSDDNASFRATGESPAGAVATRAAFLQRLAGGGAALLFGGGLAASRLIGPDRAFARPAAPKPNGLHRFRSRPDLVAPIVSVLHAGETGNGYVFIAPSSGPGARGPMIFDNRGDIVWFHPTKPRIATNFGTALYREPYVTEWSRDGAIEFDAKLPSGGQNYRAFRFPWVGRPSKPPRVGAAGKGRARRVYASWNGATEVVAWRLDSGKAAGSLTPGATVPKQGFETELAPPPEGARYAAAVALDKHGKPLRMSATLRI